MYSLMSVPDLKDELRKRNASIAGKKADLIERLEAYDRNQNVGVSLNITEDDFYQCAPIDAFRDINVDSPLSNINKQEIQEYFERFNTQPKGQNLYESRRLLTARFSTDGVHTFIRGECKASQGILNKYIYKNYKH